MLYTLFGTRSRNRSAATEVASPRILTKVPTSTTTKQKKRETAVSLSVLEAGIEPARTLLSTGF